MDDIFEGCLAIFIVVVAVVIAAIAFVLLGSNKIATYSYAYPWPYREGCVEIRATDGASAPGVYCLIEVK